MPELAVRMGDINSASLCATAALKVGVKVVGSDIFAVYLIYMIEESHTIFLPSC